MENKKTNSNKRGASSIPTQEYAQVFSDIKNKIDESQIKAVTAANRELTLLFWALGKLISEKQRKSEEEGKSIVESLSKELQNTFHDTVSFSLGNMLRMKAFFNAYEKSAAEPYIEQLPVFAIPWEYNIILLEKLKTEEERLWYAQECISNGWSLNKLESSIESGLYSSKHKSNHMT